MSIHAKMISLAAVCALASLSTSVIAQIPVKPHPQKAPPTAPPARDVTYATLPVSTVTPVLKKKPPVFTAVTPKPLVPGGTPHRIIFVGGKNQSSGDSALNPQPIPPGRPPIDPVVRK
jgi:hypothetical protein